MLPGFQKKHGEFRDKEREATIKPMSKPLPEDKSLLFVSTSPLLEDLMDTLAIKCPLIIEISPGLGGAWTEPSGSMEVIKFGMPDHPESEYFKYFNERVKKHNALSLAIERIVYARKISEVVYDDPGLKETIKFATRLYQAGVHHYLVSDWMELAAKFSKNEAGSH